MAFAAPLERLIEQLRKLPGIGAKSAQRLAFYVLRISRAEADALAKAIVEVKETIRLCSVCFNITDTDPCSMCSDAGRDSTTICVIEEPNNVVAVEKSGQFRGRYHVLHGALSPLRGIGPQDLKIGPLLERLRDGKVTEVILATNPNVEGEATAVYLARLLKPLGVSVTRLAQGLPAGGDLEFTDDLTLKRAFEGRRDY